MMETKKEVNELTQDSPEWSQCIDPYLDFLIASRPSPQELSWAFGDEQYVWERTRGGEALLS
jgi:hypothetical protein